MKKIQTALYLDPAVHGWATKRAAEDGRSLSQYIAKVLLDTSKVKPAIAAKVEWPKSDPWAAARPAARPAPALPPKDPLKHGPLKPSGFEIPPDWTNEYCKTLAEQKIAYEDDDLEYWPPKENPHDVAI